MKKNKLIGAGAIALALSLSGCDLSGLFGCSHKYGTWEIIEDPTCSDRGYKERECTLCGDVQSRSVRTDKNAHTWIEDPSSDREATCTTPGIVHSLVCFDCGKKAPGEQTGYSGHKLVTLQTQPSDPKYKAATCDESGLIAKECTVCREIVDETVKSLGHEIQVEAPVSGVISTLKCSRCDIVAGYELSVSDAIGWNKADTKMNGTTTPSNASSWVLDGTIPAGTYNVELEAKMTNESHGPRKFYNMAKTDLTVDGDAQNNSGDNPDTVSQADYRYTIKVDNSEFAPQTKESWDSLGLKADESNMVQFVDGVEITGDSQKISLCHGTIGYSLICSKIRLVRHIHENNEVVVQGGEGKVGYKKQTCSCGYTKITIDAVDGTFADGKQNKDNTPDGYIKLAANGDSISYKFALENNLIGNVYFVGREDAYPANADKNPYDFVLKNGSNDVDFADNSKNCGDVFGADADSSFEGYSAEAKLLVGETVLDSFEDINLTYVRNGSFNIAISKIVFEGRDAGHIHHYINVPSKGLPATCTVEAKEYHACSCGDYKYVATTKAEHTPEKFQIDATCTAEGTKGLKCSVCNTILTSQSIEPDGHFWSDDKIDGTRKYHTCLVCQAEEDVVEE